MRRRFATIAISDAAMSNQMRNSTAELAVIDFVQPLNEGLPQNIIPRGLMRGGARRLE
jgi:hypothetical protein